jgi:hypothetical protein
MHSCGVAAGDRWLHDHVPPLLRHGAVVVITFDEGSSNVGGGGRVPTIEVGRGVPSGRKNRRAFDHYSLLAGLERRFGLARLGRARRAHRTAIGPPPVPCGSPDAGDGVGRFTRRRRGDKMTARSDTRVSFDRPTRPKEGT